MESRTAEEVRKALDERLNEALEMTFPASDPIAIHLEDRGDDRHAEPETSQGR